MLKHVFFRQDTANQSNQVPIETEDQTPESFTEPNDENSDALEEGIDALLVSYRDKRTHFGEQQKKLKEIQIDLHWTKAKLDEAEREGQSEIEKWRKSHRHLNVRCFEQQLELEATRKELRRVDALIDAAEYKLAAVQKSSQDALATLPDPTVRAPDDILKMIFEHTVVGIINYFRRHMDKLKQAVRLAAVCGRWRAVAIDTPHLWSDIYIYLQTPLELEWHRNFILPRVRSLPCDVSIGDIATTTAPALLRASGFTEIPVIEQLFLIFSTHYDIEPVLPKWVTHSK